MVGDKSYYQHRLWLVPTKVRDLRGLVEVLDMFLAVVPPAYLVLAILLYQYFFQTTLLSFLFIACKLVIIPIVVTIIDISKYHNL